MTLYEQMKNPLIEENLDAIIKAYTDYSDFYDGLVRANKVDKITGKYSPKDKDAFYQGMYSLWKKSILYRIKNDLVNDSYKEVFKKLEKYLEQKDPKTSEEIVDTINGYSIEDDDELKDLLDKLRWDRVGEFSSWDHIKSKSILTGLHEQPPILHRLYLNCDSIIIDRFGLEFIKKCMARKKPFYFKYSDYAKRDDTIVIYSDDECLKDYIEIIKEIREEQHLENYFHKPPILTAQIEDYIGYGSEPLDPKEGEEQQSFNTKRELHLGRCIKKTTVEWMKRNCNSKFKYNDQPMTYESYSIQDLINMKRENYLRYIRSQNLKEEDFKSIDFDIALRTAILTNYQSMLESIENNTTYSLVIPYKGIELRIFKSDLSEWLRRQTKFINAHSKRYKKDLMTEIKRTQEDFEIDPNNYAVDISKKAFLDKKEPVTKLDPTENVTEEKYVVKEEPKKGIISYTPMTDEEILESRKKLGL